jgi:signal transduction histidine kinase
MGANTATALKWPATPAAPTARAVRPAPVPAPEPDDLASCLSGPNGLDLVVEMAHDLRSPLTSILFLAETLERGESGPVTASQRRQLRLMYSAALSLCATASDVLELARGSARLADRALGPFSVSEVFASVRSMVLPIAEENGLEVRLVHPKPDRRLGQPRALSRALLNLATNAVKYTAQGYVEIAARPLDATRLEFSVRDTGPGLEPEALRVLYQPFGKTPMAARHYFSSAGLGLAICRKLVAAMGSQLRVETRQGWGTRFFMQLDLPPCPAGAAADPVLEQSLDARS